MIKHMHTKFQLFQMPSIHASNETLLVLFKLFDSDNFMHIPVASKINNVLFIGILDIVYHIKMIKSPR